MFIVRDGRSVEAFPFVSVVIPVFNDPLRLRGCLEKLHSQTYPSHRFEVIVVDNGSRADLVPSVDGFPFAKLLHEAKRGSYSARNRGIAESVGEVLAFTDSDCLPEPSWIENGVAALVHSSTKGLVGGRIEVFFRDPSRPTPVELYEKVTAFPVQHYIESDQFAPTANLFTWREVINAVGSFNQDLLSGGDWEWGNRVFRQGYALVYAASAVVQHPARHTFREILTKQRRTAGGVYRVSKQSVRKVQGEKVWRGFGSVFAIWQLCCSRVLKRPQDRIQVGCVAIAIVLAKRWERLRLVAGATPQRA